MLIDKLLVYPKNMMKNLGLTKGLMFSQRLLIALIQKGLTREQAYHLVQKNALLVWKQQKEFKSLILADKDVKKILSAQEIDQCFELKYVLRNINVIFKRIGM